MTIALAVVGLAGPTSVAVAAPTAPTAAAALPATAPGKQAFTGGGSVTITHTTGSPTVYNAVFASTSQLGVGALTWSSSDRSATIYHGGGYMFGSIVDSAQCKPYPQTCLGFDLRGTGSIARTRIVLVEHPIDDTSFSFLMFGTLNLRLRIGYEMVDTQGRSYAFGGLEHLGDAPTTNATDIERTRSGAGYWIVDASGHVFAFGDAPYLGNANQSTLFPGESVSSISATPSGKGYWLFTSRGRAIPFGDARFFGDLHTTLLNGGIIGSVATPTGRGYYMVGADGGVFAFGDARFRGSMGGVRLNQPVVGLVPTRDNTGYWLIASDGGVFCFHAVFRGSEAGGLDQPVVTMVPYDSGYLMFARDGRVVDFSNQPFFGDLVGTPLPAPVINAAAAG